MTKSKTLCLFFIVLMGLAPNQSSAVQIAFQNFSGDSDDYPVVYSIGATNLSINITNEAAAQAVSHEKGEGNECQGGCGGFGDGD
jgi:hypothetical protein